MTNIVAGIEQRALTHVSCVFAESDYTYQTLSPSVAPDKLVLALPGVDTQLFHPTSYCPDGYILSVGRFSDARKNVRLLFEAYHRLRQLLPTAPQLVLAGRTGPSENDWAYAVSLGIADSVEVHEGPSMDELSRLYQGASLFVLSSDEEGLGIVILEAMASALPVVSTDCGGPRTAVTEGETGYLTPVGDAQSLARRMQDLIEDPALRRRMGEAGYEVVQQRFSLSATGRTYLERYDALL